MIRAVQTPELATVIGCVAEPVRDAPRQGTHAARVDWDAVAQLAADHGMEPLVHQSLHRDPCGCPAEVLRALRESSEQAARRNLVLVRELFRVGDALRMAQIPWASFKGPVLAQQLYGNLALRSCEDLDLWIGAEDVSRVRAALAEVSYRPTYLLSEAKERLVARLYYESTFVSDEPHRTTVDLHWDVVRPYHAFSFRGLGWRSLLTEVEVAGRGMPTFCREAEFVLLSVHATKHGWRRLVWVADLAALLRDPGAIDWTRVWEITRKLEAERMVLLGLALASEVFQVSLPGEAERRIRRSPMVGALVRGCLGRLYAAPGVARSGLADEAVFVGAMPRWSDRGKHLLGQVVLPTPLDCEMAPAADYRCYFVRPVRLMRKYVGGALRQR